MSCPWLWGCRVYATLAARPLLTVEDQVRGDPRDRHRRGLGVAGWLNGQDRRVDHAQPADAAHTQLGVDDVVGIRAHGGGADGVVGDLAAVPAVPPPVVDGGERPSG